MIHLDPVTLTALILIGAMLYLFWRNSNGRRP